MLVINGIVSCVSGNSVMLVDVILFVGDVRVFLVYEGMFVCLL